MKTLIRPALFSLACFMLFASRGAQAEVAKPFYLFHSFGFEQLPVDEIKGYGVEEISLYGHGHLWKTNDPLIPEPNFELIEFRARESAQQPGKLVCLNIEMWKLDPMNSEVTQQTIGRFRSVASRFRQAAPGVKFGIYGQIPVRNYWDPVRYAKGLSNNQEGWSSFNSLLAPAVEGVDVIMPSIYTFYSDTAGWKIYATANIAEAKKYGKPVYAFLWPQYHSADLAGSAFIDYDYWRLQLQTVYENADGVIIWTPKGVGHRWDPEAAWWRATKDFIIEHHLSPSSAGASNPPAAPILR